MVRYLVACIYEYELHNVDMLLGRLTLYFHLIIQGSEITIIFLIPSTLNNNI